MYKKVITTDNSGLVVGVKSVGEGCAVDVGQYVVPDDTPSSVLGTVYNAQVGTFEEQV